MDYKERLERATLMAMQGILAYDGLVHPFDVRKRSFEQAKATLDYIDSQLVNQETQEEQEPKRGDVVWVRDSDRQKWKPRHFIKTKKDTIGQLLFIVSQDIEQEWAFNQMTTKNPYTDGSDRP